MAAIRELKPNYRQDRARRRLVVPPQPTDVELVLNPVEDTTLHYDGSPLMQSDIVLDPNSVAVVPGSDSNYKREPWLAIGLATDNTEGANNDTVEEGIGDSPVGEPVDGSGGIHQPPTGGVEYTQVGPSRSALFFDLTGIPSDAIITEAVLELVPIEENTFDDLYGENTAENIWPSGGVVLEILNLPQDSTPDATWNTKNGDTKTVNFNIGTGTVTVPDPSARWWRAEGGIIPPNAIGVAQNTRRSDLPEPVEKAEDQINDSNFTSAGSNEIDGSPFETPDEYYGHIGYGISGGGFAVNIDESNPSQGHPTFEITKLAWQSQQDGVSVNDYTVSVLNEVTWANGVGNRQCNLLLRASHWTKNTIAQPEFVDDQITFPNNEGFEPVNLSSAIISDSSTGSAISEADPTATLFVVDDASGDPISVQYEWQIELPYVVMDDITDPVFSVINAPIETLSEGTTFQFDHGALELVPQRGGVTDILDNDTFKVEYFIDGALEREFNWTGSGIQDDEGNLISGSFTIPQEKEGQQFRVKLTISNNVDTGDGSTDSIEFEQIGTIGPDTSGTLTLSVDESPIAEGSSITATASSTGVVNPRYKFELRFPVSSEPFEVRAFDSDPTATFTVPNVESSGGEFFIRCEMENSDSQLVDTEIKGPITIIDVPEIGEVNQMKFQYNATRGPDGDRFGNVDTFISKSGTLGANFTNSLVEFEPETTEPPVQDFNVASISFNDLLDPDGAAVGAYAKIKFVGSGAAADARALRWAEHFHGIQLTIRNSSGSVVSDPPYIFSGENAETLGYRINEGDPDGNSDGVILWMNTSFPQSPNIPTPPEMRTIRQDIFDNCTQTDNGVDLVFGESEFFFDIDYIAKPEVDPGGGVIDVFDGLGVPREGSLTHPANGHSSSIVAFRIDNFDGAIQNPGGWLGPDGGQTNVGAFLVQVEGSDGNLELTDRNSDSGFSLRPEGVLDSDFFVYDNMRGIVDGDEHAEAGDDAGPFLLNISTHPSNSAINPPITYSNINVGYWTSNMDADGIYDAANETLPDPAKTFQATFTGFNVFLNTPIGSSQIAVAEVIRGGEIVGRWNLGDSRANASNKVHLFYATKLPGDGGSPWEEFYKPTTWRVGDIICISVIPETALDPSTRFFVS